MLDGWLVGWCVLAFFFFSRVDASFLIRWPNVKPYTYPMYSLLSARPKIHSPVHTVTSNDQNLAMSSFTIATNLTPSTHTHAEADIYTKTRQQFIQISANIKIPSAQNTQTEQF